MTKYMVFFCMILFFNTLLLGRKIAPPFAEYIEKCELVVQGEITHIDSYHGFYTTRNVSSLKDTAYIKINKIYKNSSKKEYSLQNSIKIFVPSRNKRRKHDDGTISGVRVCDTMYYKVGQKGIWLLQVKKSEGWNKGNFHTQAYIVNQPISKEEIIQAICKAKPEVIKFLTDIFWGKSSEVHHFLATTEIKPSDIIFKSEETNPIFLAIKHRNTGVLQEIIDFGFDINFINSYDNNALFYAIGRKRKTNDYIEILLSNGIDTNIINNEGLSIYDIIDKSRYSKEIKEIFRKYKK